MLVLVYREGTGSQQPTSGNVTIDGTTTEGDTVTANTSSISDPNGIQSLTYQWKRNGGNISGATSNTYTLVNADVSNTITVEVTVTDNYGQATVLTSSGIVPSVPTPPGQQFYTSGSSQEYTWTVPANVFEICVVCVGGGGGGGGTASSSNYGTGGGGGELRWKNNISVTPGEKYTVRPGQGGNGGPPGSGGYSGVPSWFKLEGSGSYIVYADGGSNGLCGPSGTSGGLGGSGGIGDGGGNGGRGGNSSSRGGGGAGGYTGNGGNGYGTIAQRAGSGGGGGGGSAATGGGGVQLNGQGANGAYPGLGGSGGGNATTDGGNYGGGGRGFWTSSGLGGGGSGADGAIKIIWGAGRSYPNNY